MFIPNFHQHARLSLFRMTFVMTGNPNDSTSINARPTKFMLIRFLMYFDYRKFYKMAIYGDGRLQAFQKTISSSLYSFPLLSNRKVNPKFGYPRTKPNPNPRSNPSYFISITIHAQSHAQRNNARSYGIWLTNAANSSKAICLNGKVNHTDTPCTVIFHIFTDDEVKARRKWR